MDVAIGFLETDLPLRLDEVDEALCMEGSIAAPDLGEDKLHIGFQVCHHLVCGCEMFWRD